MFLPSAEPVQAYRHADPDRSHTVKRQGELKRSAESYLNTPFIAWDGEGVTDAHGNHHYTLLANSLGQSWHGTVEKPLTTEQCFDALLTTAQKHKGIHVIYGGSYDANMMMADLSMPEVHRVYSRFRTQVKHWRISYRQGKALWIADGMRANGKSKRSMTLWDVVSFFQCKFTKACDDYLGEAWPERDMIIRMKAARGTFQPEDDAEVMRYCQAELEALVMLMTELRARLHRVGLRLPRWDGPGACAATLLTKQGVKAHKDDSIPDDVAEAGRFAYAGGRFELVRFGHVESASREPAVYEYDICSAYPRALSEVPSLAGGHWSPADSHAYRAAASFSLWHVRFTSGDNSVPQPLFRRDANGAVCYPYAVEGWYWKPEIDAAREFARRYGGRVEILAGFTFLPALNTLPFAFIPALYEQRARLKAAGDGAHVGLKLSLNSLYGKLAQQIGFRPATAQHSLKLPPYHQLEWAGYVTSRTRAAIFMASIDDLSSVVAYETDALFTTRSLPHLTIGKDLGEWEQTAFRSLSYFQSGFYFGTLTDGTEVVKTRGIEPPNVDNPLSVTRELCLTAFPRWEKVTGRTTRFITMGTALQGRWDEWRQWQTRPRVMTLEPSGKREHYPCPACSADGSRALGVLHHTAVPMGLEMRHSAEFPIAWLNPNPEMTALEEMRLDSYSQWDE